MKISKILAVSALGLFLAACKIEVIVPEGGAVKSESGTYECEAGKTCEVSVTDIFFDEVFVAHPDDGMEFTGWKKRDRGFCGGNTKPCALTTEAFEGQDHLTRFLEDDEEVFYLEATFAEASGNAACEFTQNPIGDFVFEVCMTADNLTADSCQELSQTLFRMDGTEEQLTGRDCTEGNPVGVCSTEVGDLYYYEGTSSDLSPGCGFMGGTWTSL